DARLKVWSDAVHAEIRAPELDHPARVVPAILIYRVRILAHEDCDVMSGYCSRGLEGRFAPLLRAPPFECMWIEDTSAAAVEHRHDQADHVAEVIERRWVDHLSAKDETLLARCCCVEEIRVILSEFPAKIIVETDLENPGLRLASVELKVAPFGHAIAAV